MITELYSTKTVKKAGGDFKDHEKKTGRDFKDDKKTGKDFKDHEEKQ